MYLTRSQKYDIMVYGVKYMFTECDVIRVRHIERETLMFKKLVTDDGETLEDCFFNEYALPIPGFIPVKKSADSKATMYINADKLLAIVVSDDQQDNMRTDLIKPKEYKEKG